MSKNYSHQSTQSYLGLLKHCRGRGIKKKERKEGCDKGKKKGEAEEVKILIQDLLRNFLFVAITREVYSFCLWKN